MGNVGGILMPSELSYPTGGQAGGVANPAPQSESFFKRIFGPTELAYPLPVSPRGRVI